MSSLEYPIIWTPLSEEIKPFLKYCKGLVLNAGSGKRELGLGERELNIDIVPDTEPDIIGDLHSIPLKDEAVDTIVSIAVLEHTKFPWIVTQEFYRILKPGGYGVIAVPFIQPQHACPDDYCRFTENGLVELSKYSGFEVIETAHVHHFGQTIAWLLWEYLQENIPKNQLVLKLWLWLIRQLSKGTFLASDSSNTHNTHYVVVRKPGTVQRTAEAKALLKDQSETWFFPLLSCPNTRQALHLKDQQLVSEDSSFTYSITQSRPVLLPSTDPRTWKTIIAREGMVQEMPQPAETSKATVAPDDVVANTTVAYSTVTHSTESSPAELHLLSEQAFKVSFKAAFAERLQQANPSKIAVLATNEYEGIFKNGGIGTHYKTLSEQLARNGWHVILFLCTHDQSYAGTSTVEAVQNIFSIRDLPEVLNLQAIHQSMLDSFSSEWKYWLDHQSFSALLFTQAVSNLFQGLPIYVEFHEMSGIGYHTVQAKQSGLLGANCVISVTMHSGHEWIYEANEWFAEEYPPYYQRACDYEQISFENADLTFFPSHYLKDKVQSYGWQAANAQHMPYFIPILEQNDSQPSSTALAESAVAAARKHPRGKIPVVFFGRMEMRKGIVTFVEAIKLLSPEIQEQIHVHFVGKVVRLHASKFGDLESDRYVQQELEDKVDYTLHPNFYSYQAIQFIRLLRTPVVCLASHQENFPNTGLEMGQLPVSLVVSDTGGFRETLQFVNRTAGIYWFKPADSVALADMLSKAFFNQPEIPEIPTVRELEEKNIQLWKRKLGFIEAALQSGTNQSIQASLPKVTVGVTYDNLGKSLMDCLISLEVQTYDNLEVIVLDNASTNLEARQTIEQAKAIFTTYKFVQAEPDLKLDNTRNHLLELTDGDYLLLLDANSRLSPFAVKALADASVHAQAEAIVVPTANKTSPFVAAPFRQNSVSELLQTTSLEGACFLFKTSFLKKFKYLKQPDLGNRDRSIFSVAVANGAKIVHYPYPLYEYRLRHNSMIQPASFDKERYYLRQYLAQLPASEWSPRQIYMMMTAIQALNAQQEQLQKQTQRAQAETQQVQAELAEVRQKLKNARGNLRGMRESLEHTQHELQDSNTQINAMETSKFWLLRKGWFKLKKQLNLPINE